MNGSVRRMPVKRALDVTLVLATLPLSLPLMALVALWVRLSSPGPVIHTERRIGLHLREFDMHKFRTLAVGHEVGATVAPSGDPRITTPGRVIRRWRLDELPQLFDVLCGRMSLVGPRPQRAEHLRAITPEIRERVYSMRPGITGPSAVAFLGEDEYLATVADPEDVYCRVLVPEKLRLELEYVEHWSLVKDLKLIALTLARVLSSRARLHSSQMIERIAARQARC